ncbi:hypothetical protein PV325_006877 [Microctonus aethiopoides]|uniref:Invertebrate defensins family profile domain-containing protein n=1 Tax=Microctonus aethiopoides TaxID=144406 RepID=A0AA39FZ57_9HYME|nr:hypothetical protein PV325_006877 [Microctonus aethiopoides]KAK0177844.1 hypothetical protein PV328_001853 [Microctonus aethiopoides]
MAKILIIALLAVTVAAIMAAPAEEYEPLEFQVQQSSDGNDHLRFRRVTCDLLSFKGVVGDSACAANCLSMGKAGGRCNNGICQCRKTTFGDLWNKRFGR